MTTCRLYAGSPVRRGACPPPSVLGLRAAVGACAFDFSVQRAGFRVLRVSAALVIGNLPAAILQARAALAA